MSPTLMVRPATKTKQMNNDDNTGYFGNLGKWHYVLIDFTFNVAKFKEHNFLVTLFVQSSETFHTERDDVQYSLEISGNNHNFHNGKTYCDVRFTGRQNIPEWCRKLSASKCKFESYQNKYIKIYLKANVSFFFPQHIAHHFTMWTSFAWLDIMSLDTFPLISINFLDHYVLTFCNFSTMNLFPWGMFDARNEKTLFLHWKQAQ